MFVFLFLIENKRSVYDMYGKEGLKGKSFFQSLYENVDIGIRYFMFDLHPHYHNIELKI